MLNYSSDQVKISWIGIPLTKGLSAGTFIAFASATPTFTWVPDGLGGGIRLFNADRSGEISLTMDVESRAHQGLLTLTSIDRRIKSVIGPFIMSDFSSGETIVCSTCFVVDEPDEQRATSSIAATWKFQYAGKETIPQLAGLNEVGK